MQVYLFTYSPIHLLIYYCLKPTWGLVEFNVGLDKKATRRRKKQGKGKKHPGIMCVDFSKESQA